MTCTISWFYAPKLHWYFIEPVYPPYQSSHHPGTAVQFHTHNACRQTNHKSSQHVYGRTGINRQPALGHQKSIPEHIVRTHGKNKVSPWIWSYTHNNTRCMHIESSASNTHTHTHTYTGRHKCQDQWVMAVMLGLGDKGSIWSLPQSWPSLI